MSNLNSNYDYVCCIFCKAKISEHTGKKYWVNDLKENDFDFFRCSNCGKYFKAKLYVFKEYQYILTIPTKKETEKIEALGIKESIRDIEGQKYMWNDLFPNES